MPNETMPRGFKVLYPNAKVPERATKKSAGYDFYLPEDLWLSADPESVAVVSTGMTVHMQDNEVFQLYLRSSLAKKGLFLANGVGIIDADYYPNEIKVLIRNFSGEEIVLNKGDRIVQGIFTEYKVSDDVPSEDRVGGFGSTGS